MLVNIMKYRTFRGKIHHLIKDNVSCFIIFFLDSKIHLASKRCAVCRGKLDTKNKLIIKKISVINSSKIRSPISFKLEG